MIAHISNIEKCRELVQHITNVRAVRAYPILYVLAEADCYIADVGYEFIKDRSMMVMNDVEDLRNSLQRVKGKAIIAIQIMGDGFKLVYVSPMMLPEQLKRTIKIHKFLAGE
jgi:hypothetical protein